MKLAVVIAAHSNARALDWTLHGYQLQTRAPDELILAEDGESPEVGSTVARHAAAATFPLRHLTQPNRGFGKWRLMNRAIAECTADFVVFTDADCIPRNDVVATFAALARPGRFLTAGSHINLPASFHETRLDAAMIESGRLFDRRFLAAQGITAPRLRLLPGGRLARLLDRLSPRDAFVGNLSGAWRADLLRVAGFDEAIGYGGGDRNLGLRLNNAGVRGDRARHSLVCLHLDHPRAYRDLDEVARNLAFNATLPGSGTILPRESSLLK